MPVLAPLSTFDVRPPASSACGCGRDGRRGLARVGVPLGDELLGLADERGAVGDALLDADVDERLAGEAARVLDRQVVGEDDRVGGGDDVGAERRGAGRPLGLHPHRVACCLRGVLQALGRHVGVGDAGGARRDTDEVEHALGCRCSGSAGAVGVRRCGGRLVERDLVADDPDDLGLGRRGGERGLEVLLHERAGELGQHLHVGVTAALGRRDEEDQGGRTVLGTPVDPVGGAAEDERRLGDGGAAGVRDADAAGQPGRHGLLALAHVAQERVDVGAPARGDEALAEPPGRLVAIGTGEVEDDLLFGDQGHGIFPFRRDDQWFGVCGRVTRGRGRSRARGSAQRVCRRGRRVRARGFRGG